MRTYLQRHLLVGLVAVIILLGAAASGLAVWAMRTDAIEAANEDARNLSIVLGRQIADSVQSIELVIGELQGRLDALGAKTPDDFQEIACTEAMHELLVARLSRLPQAEVISLVDRDGRILNFTRSWPVPSINLADRDYFAYAKADRDGKLFVSIPVPNKVTGKMTLYLVKRLSAPNGDFLGIVLIGVGIDYFQRVYSQVDPLSNRVFALLRTDGTVLLRYPGAKDFSGEKLPASSGWYKQVARGGGHYWSPGVFDGEPQLVAVQPIKNYPIVLDIVIAEKIALKIWYSRAIMIGIGGGTGLLCLGLLIWMLGRKTAELERTNARFHTAISNMKQGLCLFDANKRLVISNDRYQDTYRLPDELVRPGTPLERILQFYADRGDISDATVDGKIQEQRQYYKSADGREILIQREWLLDGSWVATHEDMTDQRRLEVSLAEKAADLELVNAHFDAALNSMSQGLCLFDADRKVVVSNLRYAMIYDLRADQIKPGTPLAEILKFRQEKGTNHKVDASVYLDVNVRRPNEIQELADGRFVAISRQQMRHGGWLTVHEDITERRKLEQERDQSRAFLHQIIEHIPTQITVKGARDRRYVLLNRVAEARLGPAAEVIGKTVNDIFPKPAAEKITDDDDQALRSGDEVFLEEHAFEIREGEKPRYMMTKRVSVRDENGEAAYLINLAEDVTERKRSDDRIAFLAHHDQLTGLANRARFAEKLDEAARRCARYGTPFSVFMLDLDKFKHVNDTLGHPAGDQLLVEVAQRLKSSLRETDVLARLGGDEFAIIQAGESNQREGAIGLALRIIDVIAKPFDLNGNQATIGTSIGIAFAPECGVDPESLLNKADLALYEAKSEGRNDYRVFNPEMAAVSSNQKILEAELRAAIQRNEFELHYQPVVDANTGLTCAAEALVRWRHPSRGLVPPDQFIPIAETSGLMIPLGEWILQQACQDAASWPAHVKVAINISAVQFNNANLFDVVLCALVRSGLSPERLELEITETMLLKNEQACLLTIRQMRNLGIAIALDDFGIGYSSSSYLTRVPFDKVKIDRSFVRGFPDRRECTAIVQSVVALARGLDMTVTAEGVETRAQLEALRTAGVQLVQGYLFGRPVPLNMLDLNRDSPQAKNVA